MHKTFTLHKLLIKHIYVFNLDLKIALNVILNNTSNYPFIYYHLTKHIIEVGVVLLKEHACVVNRITASHEAAVF